MEREPQQQENLKVQLIARLRRLKTEYRDGIPDEIKHSSSPDGRWKVQKGVWFQVVANGINRVLEKHLSGEVQIPQVLFDEALAYFLRLTAEDNPFKQRLTQQEDIDEAETMIDKLIAELEK